MRRLALFAAVAGAMAAVAPPAAARVERCPGTAGPRFHCSHVTVPPVAAVSACAAQLGARRAFYTSRDSADDMEAVRQSIGVDRISLFGGSYGTYTALTYARRYPQHVESLILDSPVAPGGLDAL